MKTLILILLIATGCTISVGNDHKQEPDFEMHQVGTFSKGYTQNINKLFIDGCMYITITGKAETSITHAGNCPNQIHNQKN